MAQRREEDLYVELRIAMHQSFNYKMVGNAIRSQFNGLVRLEIVALKIVGFSILARFDFVYADAVRLVTKRNK
jgi:hypothetical protein